ncbi:LytR family transcriptional regulator [Priestia koreensis]|uniref:Polyisoprenyl-teichoic acid--peptidoglycan teichoic acid transferase TagU n=1 Tax=Priestia koreensis TaxID=284581 RepID=A0A0M0LHF8_9BACI|nr:LytR family transcriptional regulator [Priestia koreensis]KOO50416.1 trascriptional regulator [Priestia koreensis]
MKKKSRKKKWLWIVLGIVAVLLLSTGAYAYSIYHSVRETFNQTEEPLHREKSSQRKEQVNLNQNDPISILLLGVDEREKDRGRSDSMMLLAVNPKTNSVKMVSIPRDTRTEIVGKGKVDKINHAYAFGGVEMSIETVENFLHVPIDYYVKVNMESFKDIVDAVGGVHVQNPFSFSSGGYTFKKGELDLDGNEALAYSRMRKQDPRGDFGRQERQRQIIQAVIKEGASLSSLTNYQDILDSIAKNMKTNLTFDDMIRIQKNYKNASGNLQQVELNGAGEKINGIYYLSIPEKERSSVSQMLRKQLGI